MQLKQSFSNNLHDVFYFQLRTHTKIIELINDKYSNYINN